MRDFEIGSAHDEHREQLRERLERRNETLKKAIDGWNKFRPHGVERDEADQWEDAE